MAKHRKEMNSHVLWRTVKAVLRGEFVVLNIYIRREVRWEIANEVEKKKKKENQDQVVQ